VDSAVVNLEGSGQDLDMIKGSTFKQRANTSTVKLYADKTQEEERINLLANANEEFS
jgi:hypothetical protein